MVGSPWTAGVSLPLILVRCRTCWWCNLASKRQNAGPTAGFHVSRHPGLASLPVTAALLNKTAESVALHKRSRLGREVRGCLLLATSHVRSRQDPAEHRANPVRMIRCLCSRPHSSCAKSLVSIHRQRHRQAFQLVSYQDMQRSSQACRASLKNWQPSRPSTLTTTTETTRIRTRPGSLQQADGRRAGRTEAFDSLLPGLYGSMMILWRLHIVGISPWFAFITPRVSA